MFHLGLPELVVIFFILLLIFGASRLKDLGGALGKGIKSFKKEIKEDKENGDKPA